MATDGPFEYLHRKLDRLRFQYFQVIEPSRLRWPRSADLLLPQVQDWLNTELFENGVPRARQPVTNEDSSGPSALEAGMTLAIRPRKAPAEPPSEETSVDGSDGVGDDEDDDDSMDVDREVTSDDACGDWHAGWQTSFLPPKRYRIRVLEMLITKLEAAISDPEEDAISDALLATFSGALKEGVPSELQSVREGYFVSYIHQGCVSRQCSLRPAFHDRVELTHESRWITLMESPHVISSGGTTGLRTWEAALHLGQFLASTEGMRYVEKKRVVELGAGTGYLSLFLHKFCGVRRIWATDGSPQAVESIARNFMFNGYRGRPEIKCNQLSWGDIAEVGGHEDRVAIRGFDVIIGADITFNGSEADTLADTFVAFERENPGIVAIISATVRNESTLERFLKAFEHKGFSIEEIIRVSTDETHQSGPFYRTDFPLKIFHIYRYPLKPSR